MSSPVASPNIISNLNILITMTIQLMTE